MPEESDDPACRRCERPVRVGRDHYETFEGMHYVCFHYEFEHDRSGPGTDPDEDCGWPGCPSGPGARHRDRVVAAVRTLLADWSQGAPAHWGNHSLPGFLESMAAWLADCESHYADRGVPVPWSGWEVIQDALRAAADPGRT